MKVIEYYRVSTQKQGLSGLGLEAQEATVQTYIRSINATSISRFIEIESAGNKDRISVNTQPNINTLLKKRPKLQEAITLALREDATIIVKEASRLTRFSLLINHLIAANVKFRAASSPNDDELMLRIKTALNEEELKKVSERTTAALQARKNRGQALGNPQYLTDEARAKGVAAVKANGKEANKQLIELITMYREKGIKNNETNKYDKGTYQAIADKLNSLGYRTRYNKTFCKGNVKQILDRYTQFVEVI